MKKKNKTSAFGTSKRESFDSSGFYDSKLYSSMKLTEVENVERNPFPENLKNAVLLASSENMSDLPDNSLDLMITSPPYNVSKEYDDDLSLDEYLALLERVFAETYRVLVNGGRACVNIANVGRKPYAPLSDYISQIMTKIGYNMRGEIIWNKAASAGVSTAWGSWMSAANPVLRDVHEYILAFSKGSLSKEKSDKENTINKEQFVEYTKSVWSMNPESAKKVKHPAPFPVELPFRLIQLYSFKGDIVLDPFMGSGSTAVAAVKSNRFFVGYEINEEYRKTAIKRIEEFKQYL